MKSFFAILFILIIILFPNGITDQTTSNDHGFFQNIENINKLTSSKLNYPFYPKSSIFENLKPVT